MNDPVPSASRPNWFKRFQNWWDAHHERLISLDDTPHKIALGVAIGIFFGFTPLWSMKTLLSIGVAWLLNSNKIAAAISVTLHDVILPFMPAIYWWEYKIGFRILYGHLPQHQQIGRIPLRDFLNWGTFIHVAYPALVGSLFLALPSAVLFYFLMRGLVGRAQKGRRGL